MIDAPATTTASSELTKTLGFRVAYARRKADLSQERLSETLGFADRQTLSSIENGERRVQPQELLKMSEALGRPLEWFLDPFVIAGEGDFSWRVAPKVSKDDLDIFEQETGAWIGLIRFLRRAMAKEDEPFLPVLRIDSSSSYEYAIRLGEKVGVKLKLGDVPASNLIDRVESELDVPVLFFDGRPATGDVSGAMCKMRELRVILINRNESPARRNFDLAHELFHALTWDALKPEHRESNAPGNEKVNPGKSVAQRIERLADNFAAGLLMPSSVIDRVDRSCCQDISYLAGVAKLLQVSNRALAFRLLNAKIIEKTVCDALVKRAPEKEPMVPPKRFSAKFVKLIHSGIDDGYVASRKVAKTLGLTLQELANLFEEHDLPSQRGMAHA